MKRADNIRPYLTQVDIFAKIKPVTVEVRNGDIVKLFHQQTSTTLLAHDVASPLTSTNEEFTTWPLNSTHRRPHEEEFQIHVSGNSHYAPSALLANTMCESQRAILDKYQSPIEITGSIGVTQAGLLAQE